jgi:hypothetical protein
MHFPKAKNVVQRIVLFISGLFNDSFNSSDYKRQLIGCLVNNAFERTPKEAALAYFNRAQWPILSRRLSEGAEENYEETGLG